MEAWRVAGVVDDDDDGDDDDDDDSGIVLPWRGEDKEERQLQRQWQWAGDREVN